MKDLKTTKLGSEETSDGSIKVEGRGKMKGVWTIIEDERKERPLWVRMGTAFINRDDSLNVYLDGFPINGKLHIRDIEPRRTAEA